MKSQANSEILHIMIRIMIVRASMWDHSHMLARTRTRLTFRVRIEHNFFVGSAPRGKEDGGQEMNGTARQGRSGHSMTAKRRPEISRTLSKLEDRTMQCCCLRLRERKRRSKKEPGRAPNTVETGNRYPFVLEENFSMVYTNLLNSLPTFILKGHIQTLICLLYN